ncbi:piggyBac transposable element-derived protein 4-like [Poecilia reticulata]|uniref:PiggyBac transposable element-derived protein 4-like n=1 Tax=Poecilia reticulata TaxID=8081 RepID=A0A3P9NUM5_POERE|nr:PREDICTED: piggyBac transposable element-derived protein 4-like [Poecilia reticulata]
MKPRRDKKLSSFCEALGLTAADHDDNEVSTDSSDPDFADSGDEADFLEGIDPLHEDEGDYVEEKKVKVKEEKDDVEQKDDKDAIVRSVVAGGKGRKRSRKSRFKLSKKKRSRSETHSSYNGRWKTEKEPDHMPRPPLHFFPKRKPGVQPPLSYSKSNPSPSELFKMYFDQTTIKILCVNTNKNAARHLAAGKKCKWTDIKEGEMYQYIGLTLYMGILKRPQLKDFWKTTTIFQVLYPPKVMPRDRFINITANIHMSDPVADAVNDSKKGTPEYDCLHRLRPLYNSVQVACKAVYQPQQHLSVDERMVATKAKIRLKQYMKRKPTKWGIKLFVLSDNTGYTIDFQIYTGKASEPSGKGMSFDAVMSLIKKAYLGSGYQIYGDNFYTSPALFSHLYELGFGACGTFRSTRIGIPKTTENALTKKSPRGSIRWIREGPLLFVKWMNIREVNLCSTLHTAFSGDTIKKMEKAGGKLQELEFPVPPAVLDYNRYMGGVDLSDQLIGSYSSRRKSRKWYMTVLHHFIDIAVTNSYLLHKEMCGRLKERALTHQQFFEQLTTELCGVSPTVQKTSYDHLPVAIVEGATGSKKTTEGRRRCRICKRSTPFMCEACKLPLCVIVDRNCHKVYHSSGGRGKK